jgi:hypothetical protein
MHSILPNKTEGDRLVTSLRYAMGEGERMVTCQRDEDRQRRRELRWTGGGGEGGEVATEGLREKDYGDGSKQISLYFNFLGG